MPRDLLVSSLPRCGKERLAVMSMSTLDLGHLVHPPSTPGPSLGSLLGLSVCVRKGAGWRQLRVRERGGPRVCPVFAGHLLPRPVSPSALFARGHAPGTERPWFLMSLSVQLQSVGPRVFHFPLMSLALHEHLEWQCGWLSGPNAKKGCLPSHGSSICRRAVHCGMLAFFLVFCFPSNVACYHVF